MPTITYLEAIRGRKVIFEEIKEHIEKVKQEMELEGLEVTKDIIQ